MKRTVCSLSDLQSWGYESCTRGAWHAGLEPFRTVKWDGMIFGRGTINNKEQHLINPLALQAVLEVKCILEINVTVLDEMDE